MPEKIPDATDLSFFRKENVEGNNLIYNHPIVFVPFI